MSVALARCGEGVALVVALTVAAVMLRAPSGSASVVGDPAVAAGLPLAAIAGWIVWQDLATLTISDAAVAALAALACALRWSDAAAYGEPARSIATTLCLDALLPGGALLLFRELYYRLRGVDGLGLGDVKLAAAGGLLVGTLGFAWALFAASLVGLVGVAALRWLRSPTAPLAGAKLAFGAVLAPAILAVWLAERWPAVAAAIGP